MDILKTIEDNELGVITLIINPRARRYSLRIRNGIVTGIIPPGGDLKIMLGMIERNRPKLVEMQKKYPPRPILDEANHFKTHTFQLYIFRAPVKGFRMKLSDGLLHIACPDDTRFADPHVQDLLYSFIERAMRHEAKRVLPLRLRELAWRHGFNYQGVSIRNSKTRWGSCSSRKTISLSLSILLLPPHLIDYVLLHELCHTCEMNHSPRFWQLMDTVTNNTSSALRKELKTHRIL